MKIDFFFFFFFNLYFGFLKFLTACLLFFNGTLEKTEQFLIVAELGFIIFFCILHPS